MDRLTVKNELKFKLKFYLAADYNTNKVLNELHKKYAPTLPYNGDVIPLRNELIQMFDEDESAKFIIESGGEEITVSLCLKMFIPKSIFISGFQTNYASSFLCVQGTSIQRHRSPSNHRLSTTFLLICKRA